MSWKGKIATDDNVDGLDDNDNDDRSNINNKMIAEMTRC